MPNEFEQSKRRSGRGDDGDIMNQSSDVDSLMGRGNDYPDVDERVRYTEIKNKKRREDYVGGGISRSNDLYTIAFNYVARLSPFDRNEYHYNNSIFRDEFKKSSPQKGDLLINMYNYSSNRIHSCSLLKDNQYAEVFSSVLSVPNTLISNLIKIFIYKKEFNKDYFIKKIGYSIFKIK